MKKLLVIIASCLAIAANAQTTNVSNQLPTISGALSDLWSAVSTSGLSTATNYAVEPYITYAPQAPKGSQVGGGVFVAYNINQFVGAGIGVDFLGQFSLVSANIQLKAPIQVGQYIPSSWTFLGAATNAVITPIVIGGLAKGLGGTSAGAIAVTDAGAYVSFGHLMGGKFTVGGAYGRWDNAGVYSGPRYHFFAGWSVGI
jgi:hypothetical protein